MNFNQAVRFDADWPIMASTMHARHVWLVERRQDLTRRLEGDPEFFDAKAAGYWIYLVNNWIGADCCSGRGPWQRVDVGDGFELQQTGGRPGIKRKRPHLADAGRGIYRPGTDIREYLRLLSERLRFVRICCGDWSTVLGPAVTTELGITAIVLDPPFGLEDGREPNLYAQDKNAVGTCLSSGWNSPDAQLRTRKWFDSKPNGNLPPRVLFESRTAQSAILEERKRTIS